MAHKQAKVTQGKRITARSGVRYGNHDKEKSAYDLKHIDVPFESSRIYEQNYPYRQTQVRSQIKVST